MKILISPGFGAGWSTWMYGDDPAERKFALTYQPIIDAIEKGEGLTEEIRQQFEEDFDAKFGEDSSHYTGGFRDLVVVEVEGAFKVDEYDGFESVTRVGDPDFLHTRDF